MKTLLQTHIFIGKFRSFNVRLLVLTERQVLAGIPLSMISSVVWSDSVVMLQHIEGSYYSLDSNENTSTEVKLQHLQRSTLNTQIYNRADRFSIDLC